MPQKRHKQQTQPPKPILALIIGGILLLAAALFFTFSSANESGTPKLAVDQEKIDYGDVKFGVNKAFSIKITNTGDGVLRFKEKPYIQVLEGC